MAPRVPRETEVRAPRETEVRARKASAAVDRGVTIVARVVMIIGATIVATTAPRR